MRLGGTFRNRNPERRAGLALCIAVLPALVAFPGEAEAVRRACDAKGALLPTYRATKADGSLVQRTDRIDIAMWDLMVRVSGYTRGGGPEDIKQAKKIACSEATQCFLALASGADSCQARYYGTIFETIKKPAHIDAWRRQVACNHAEAGHVSQLPGPAAGGTVRLLETKIEATASRDSVTDTRYQTVRENDHLCWQPLPDPDGVAHFPPGVHPFPKPEPPRPASDDLRVPFQVTGGSLEVTPSLHNGPCPTQIELEASLNVVGQGTVRFRLNHKGGRGPIRTVTFPEGGTRTSTTTYTVGAADGGGGPTEGMAAPGGSGGGAIGGFQQGTAPNQHTGWFELEIVSPRSPFKKSQPAHYKVVCKPTPAIEPVDAQLVPGIGGGGGGRRKDGPAQPPAGAPDLILESATLGRDGACRLVVGNAGKQRSARTVVQLSARGRKPIDLDLPPIPPGGRQAVPVKDLGDLRWLVHLDRGNAVRESDEDNNRAWIRGCRPVAGR